VEGYARFSPANSKWTKHTVAEHVSLGGNGPLFVGTPSQVADSLETWVREADVDGFNFVSLSRFPAAFSSLTASRAMSSFPSLSRILSTSSCPNYEREGYSGMSMLSQAAHSVRTSTNNLDKSSRLTLIRLQSIGGQLVFLRRSIRFPSRTTQLYLQNHHEMKAARRQRYSLDDLFALFWTNIVPILLKIASNVIT
jgi:hypothetical protein